MGDVPAMIDHGYLVSVRELRELCNILTTGNLEYRVFRPNDSRVLIRFNDDPKDTLTLNALCSLFCIPNSSRDLWSRGVLRQNSMRTENRAIPCHDGCLIQVISSPSNAKNLSR
jgi:hypothetical protein